MVDFPSLYSIWFHTDLKNLTKILNWFGRSIGSNFNLISFPVNVKQVFFLPDDLKAFFRIKSPTYQCLETMLKGSIFEFCTDEAAKWEKITYLGIASCTALAVYVLSKGHHHGEDPPVSFSYNTSIGFSLFNFGFGILNLPYLLRDNGDIASENGNEMKLLLKLAFLPFLIWLISFILLCNLTRHRVKLSLTVVLPLQAYPYLHIRNKEFPWGMYAFPVSLSYCFAFRDLQLWWCSV